MQFYPGVHHPCIQDAKSAIEELWTAYQCHDLVIWGMLVHVGIQQNNTEELLSFS